METEILAQTHPGAQVETPKKLLAKTGNKDWLLLVLVQAFAFVLQFVLGLLIGLCYALQHKKPDMISLQNTLSNPAITMLPTFAAELITFMIARKLLKQKIGDHFRKPVVSSKFLSAGCIVALGASCLGSLLVSVLQMLLSPTGFHFNMPVLLSTSDPNLLILGILNVCVFAPILEELLFRGFLLRSLLPYGSAFAIISSAVLFGVMHGNLMQAIPTTLLGLVLAYIRVRANSIIPTILIHSANNILFVVFTLLPRSDITEIISAVLFIALIAAAVVLFIINRKKIWLANGHSEAEEMPAKKKAAAFYFQSVCFYVLAALFIFNTISLSIAKG